MTTGAMSSFTHRSENIARKRLLELHGGLLRLHKQLLDSERVAYEQLHGRIPTAGAFLQLVINDGWFSWLRVMSELIVQIDEVTDAKEPVQPGDANRFLEQARNLLVPNATGEGFGKRYYEALQRDPGVVLSHKETLDILRGDVVE
jgi:hypothetical protein